MLAAGLVGMVVRRLALGVVVVAIVNLGVFATLRSVPGDPVRLLLGEGASEAEVGALRAQLGLDRPVWEQAIRFVLTTVRGELGRSLRSGRPVEEELGRALPVSLVLVSAAIGGAGLVGIGTGWLGAVRRGTWMDGLLSAGSAIAGSLPAYLLGTVALVVFAGKLRWLPSGGAESARHFVLPVVTLLVVEAAVVFRVSRAAVAEVVGSEYVRTAVAKGLDRRRVMWRHVLPNAMVPVIGLLAADFGRLVGGAVVIESIFALPGVGYLVVEAVRYRDYPLLQGAVLVLMGIAVVTGVLSDLMAALVDPRLRRG